MAAAALKLLRTVAAKGKRPAMKLYETPTGKLRFKVKSSSSDRFTTVKDGSTQHQKLLKTFKKPNSPFDRPPPKGFKPLTKAEQLSKNTAAQKGRGFKARIKHGAKGMRVGSKALRRKSLGRLGGKVVGKLGAKMAARGALTALGPIGGAAMLAWLGYDVASAGVSAAQSGETDEDLIENFLSGGYQDQLAGELGSARAELESESSFMGDMADAAETKTSMERTLGGSAITSELQVLLGGQETILRELAQQDPGPSLNELAAQYGAL